MFEQQIQNGVTYLNQLIPGWYNHVDLEKLVMSSHCECICGQLDHIFTQHRTDLENLAMSEWFGFFVPYGDEKQRRNLWYTLQDEWTDKILELRAAKQPNLFGEPNENSRHD